MTQTINKPLYELTAGDIASEKMVTIPVTASLQDAAKLLAEGRHSGAPVVDVAGRLVGVISVSDIVRSVARQPTAAVGTVRSCDYQEPKRLPRGGEIVVCKLEAGRCPFQRGGATLAGVPVTACIAPTEIVTDWHTVELNTLPPEDVLHYMTADPVTVAADTPIRALAREMIDAMVHRVIVVDKQFHPVGIVSSMDLVAALARSPVTP